jgi:LysM repeat protein
MEEYVVGQNDTLEKIAAVHDVTVGAIVAQNRLRVRMVFFNLFMYKNV